MDTPLLPNNPVPDAPFVIELLRLPEGAGSHFRPAAQVVLAPPLRTGGLLAALPADELKTLLYLFTFVSPNGHVQPSVPELATAMGMSEAKARARLHRLESVSWRGEPLVRRLPRATGLDAYVPAPRLVTRREILPPPPEERALPAAGREAVVAHSRAAYARPRAEVEAEIEQRMVSGPAGDDGAPPSEESRAKVRLKLQLLHLGVAKDQADALLARYPPEAIARQIAWLPYRQAKNPAAFVVAAVEKDYEPPRQRETSPAPRAGATTGDNGARRPAPPGEGGAVPDRPADPEGHGSAA